MKVYLICGKDGKWSDSEWWVDKVYHDKLMADNLAAKLNIEAKKCNEYVTEHLFTRPPRHSTKAQAKKWWKDNEKAHKKVHERLWYLLDRFKLTGHEHHFEVREHCEYWVEEWEVK